MVYQVFISLMTISSEKDLIKLNNSLNNGFKFWEIPNKSVTEISGFSIGFINLSEIYNRDEPNL
ncbi:MAG: hypothetical protein ACFFG0_22010 [Candidatus Thorarchaeota archaeon]